MRSRRTLALIAALEEAGHTNVVVTWLLRPGRYVFTSDQRSTPKYLGNSLQKALSRIPAPPAWD